MSRFQFIKNQQNCSNVNISVNLKDTKRVDYILERHSIFLMSFISYRKLIKHIIQVVSQFPYF